MSKSILVSFVGGIFVSPVEELVRSARYAATLDLAERALASQAFDSIVIALDRPPGGETPVGLVLDVVPGKFNFARRLSGIIERFSPEGIVYMGGGALPLLSSIELKQISASLQARSRVVITNNLYSSDLVAFRPASTFLDLASKVGSDNGLARLLAQAGRLEVSVLPYTPSYQFDIDSPADLCVLALVGGAGTRLQALLEAQQFDLSRYQRLLPLLTDRNAQLLLAGRVGSKAWAYLEQETACRVRLFSEERGMVADGRLAAAQARSLLGFFLERTGVEDFFQVLPQLCDAAVIDTRVLLAHLESAASRQDRFLSDLSVWEEIEDEFLREFTRLACAAEVPVLLGGHSLLAGGLLSLIEFAWKQREADGAA